MTRIVEMSEQLAETLWDDPTIIPALRDALAKSTAGPTVPPASVPAPWTSPATPSAPIPAISHETPTMTPKALTPAQREAIAMKLGPQIMAEWAAGSYPADFSSLRGQIIDRQVDNPFETLQQSYDWVKANLIDVRGQKIEPQGTPAAFTGPIDVTTLSPAERTAFSYAVGNHQINPGDLVSGSWAAAVDAIQKGVYQHDESGTVRPEFQAALDAAIAKKAG